VKVIIAGGRDITDYATVAMAMTEAGFAVTEVVSGTAAGVDRLGEEWAQRRGLPIKRFPAPWTEFGKAAGPIRNRQMAEYADALVAVWDGKSRGTKNMINQARARGLVVHVHRV
jgi:hypothetical protein